QRDLGAGAAEGAEIRRIGGAADFGREHAIGRDDLELRSGFGDEFGGGEAGVSAIVVVDDHLAARPRGAREKIPTGHREFAARVEELDVRRAAGGDDDDVWIEAEHVVCARESVEAKGDPESFALARPPVDDADDFTPALERGGEHDLTPGPGRGLEDDDVVP